MNFWPKWRFYWISIVTKCGRYFAGRHSKRDLLLEMASLDPQDTSTYLGWPLMMCRTTFEKCYFFFWIPLHGGIKVPLTQDKPGTPPQKPHDSGGGGDPYQYFQKFWSNRYTSKNIFEDLSFLDSEKIFCNLRVICATKNWFWISIFFQNRRILAILKVFLLCLFCTRHIGTKIWWSFENFHWYCLESKYLTKVETIFDSEKIFWYHRIFYGRRNFYENDDFYQNIGLSRR